MSAIFPFLESNTTVNDEVTYEVPTFENYSAFSGGAQDIAIESYQDQLLVMESLAYLENRSIAFEAASRVEERDEEQEAALENLTTVLEAAGGGVFEKIQNALTRLWGKVKAFFASIMRYLDSMFKSGGDFVKKYESQLLKANTSGYKLKMFKYTNLDAQSVDGAVSKASAIVEKAKATVATTIGKVGAGASEAQISGLKDDLRRLEEGKSELIEGFRGALLSKGRLNADEFSKGLYANFRDGKENKDQRVEMDVDVKGMIETLKGSTKLVETAKKAQAKVDEGFKKALAHVTAARSKVKGAKVDDNGTSSVKVGDNQHTFKGNAAGVLASLLRYDYDLIAAQQSANTAYFQAWVRAVKERDSEYKSALRGALSYTKKD